MRVISQDGTIDTPYELSMIWIREKYGYTVIANMPNDEPAGLGKYSSREKALKAMEMLREAYNNNEFYHRTATTNTFQETIGLLSNEKFKEVTSEYFQFPQDEEIEV